MRWFKTKGVKEGNPEGLIMDEGDKHKRELAIKSMNHIGLAPSLSRRAKNLHCLHISLNFHH